jgi:hypothetical protein
MDRLNWHTRTIRNLGSSDRFGALRSADGPSPLINHLNNGAPAFHMAAGVHAPSLGSKDGCPLDIRINMLKSIALRASGALVLASALSRVIK